MTKKILNRITNNIGLKLISVLISVVLWLVVVNIDNPQMTVSFTAPAEIVNESIIKDNGKVYEVIDNSDAIKFSVTGPRTIVEGMSASDFIVTADMSKIDLELGLVPVEVTAERYASKVSITVKTTNVRVSIENVKSQQFAVTANSIGTPMDGYAVGKVVCEPATITVTGAESVINSIDKVSAGVNVDGMYSDRVQNVVPQLYNKEGQRITATNVTIEPSMVQITAQILETKSVPVIYEYTGTLKSGYTIDSIKCLPETITLKGEKSNLAKVDELRIPSEVLDLSGATESQEKSISIASYLPEGVEPVNEDQSSVVIKVDLNSYTTKTLSIPIEDVIVKKLSSDMEVHFISKTVKVTLEGEKDAVRAISEEDLELTLDLEGVKKGESLQLQPTVNTLKGIEEISVSKIKLDLLEKNNQTEEEETE
ncbi:MAG: YbbR-like domain-containing protein [Lachnospiraceae bacterium]